MNVKTEKVRIIVAFGDIQGYTDFLDEITNEETEFLPFDAEFDAIIEQAEKESGDHFGDTGDGFMLVVDLGPGHNCETAIRVLNLLWKILKKMERLIDGKEHPRPTGFRIVIDSGYVFRKIRQDGKILFRGRHINRAHNELAFARGRGIVCGEGVKNLISDVQAKAHGFQFTNIDGKKLYLFKMVGDRRKQRVKSFRSRKG